MKKVYDPCISRQIVTREEMLRAFSERNQLPERDFIAVSLANWRLLEMLRAFSERNQLPEPDFIAVSLANWRLLEEEWHQAYSARFGDS